MQLRARPPPAAPEPRARVLVLVDLSRSEPGTLAPALAVSHYEAGLLTRRGGLHLVRAASPEEAAAEAERLRSLGAQPILVPEAEVRAAPVPCLEGEREGDGLRLRSAQGSLTLAPGDVFLVVSGPIRREHQARAERRKFRTASLDEGFRVHLHRRSASPPLEIDALNFEIGFAPSGSVRLELESWLEAATRAHDATPASRGCPPCWGPPSPSPGAARCRRRTRSPRPRASTPRSARSCSTISRSSASTPAAWRRWSGGASSRRRETAC